MHNFRTPVASMASGGPPEGGRARPGAPADRKNDSDRDGLSRSFKIAIEIASLESLRTMLRRFFVCIAAAVGASPVNSPPPPPRAPAPPCYPYEEEVTNIDFKSAKVTVDNLGGRGPDAEKGKPPILRFDNVPSPGARARKHRPLSLSLAGYPSSPSLRARRSHTFLKTMRCAARPKSRSSARRRSILRTAHRRAVK